MRHAIVTSIDSKYGIFFINHWLRSVIENINLKNIDIIVLDYGLTEEQRRVVQKERRVKTIKCVRDGNVTSLRYRDLLKVIKTNSYDQLLVCDSGDLFFQADISNIFEQNKNTFRVVTEKIFLKFEHMYQTYIKSSKLRKEVIELLKDKNAINGGFIVASANSFKKFCEFYLENVKSLDSYGVDQVLITYYLYKNGFVALDKTYNYMLISNFHTDRYQIIDNSYYTSDGKLINVVHNLGGNTLVRGMYRFGYKTKQRFNYLIYLTRIGSRTLNFLVSIPFKTVNLFKR